jgi:thiol-disulfide isomerase/thioredoxin
MKRNRLFSASLLSFVVLAAGGVLTCGACGGAGASAHAGDNHEGSSVGQPLPDLQLAGLHGGKDVKLTDLRGKVVLLDVWASWCAPCKQELPMLDDMSGRLRPKGIEILAVSVDENHEDAELFLKQARANWSIAFAHDPEGKLTGALQPPKMPSSYLVDRSGVVRELNAGFTHDDAERIESSLVALAEKGPSDDRAVSSLQAEDRASSLPGKNATEDANGTAGATRDSSSAARHPVPSASGAIDGQPFEPKLARVTGRMQKDGRIALAVGDRTECGAATDVKAGDATLTLVVPWKDGYTADLAKLARPSKKAGPAISFRRLNGSKKSVPSKTFKPSGKVTIVSAPMEQNAVGKMQIELASGDYSLTGELDIQVCVAPR